MAICRFDSELYNSEDFIESAGAVLFRLSTQEICVLRLLASDEYVLAKGRRNCEEHLQAAAIRESTEETGYPCHLLRVNMLTRAPPAMREEHLDDTARFYTGICEPFHLLTRRFTNGSIKIIY